MLISLHFQSCTLMYRCMHMIFWHKSCRDPFAICITAKCSGSYDSFGKGIAIVRCLGILQLDPVVVRILCWNLVRYLLKCLHSLLVLCLHLQVLEAIRASTLVAEPETGICITGLRFGTLLTETLCGSPGIQFQPFLGSQSSGVHRN